MRREVLSFLMSETRLDSCLSRPGLGLAIVFIRVMQSVLFN